MLLGQHAFHMGELPARIGFPAFAGFAVIAIWRRHHDRVHQQRRVGGFEQRHIANRQRAKRFTVITVLQRDKAALFWPALIEPVVKTHLQRDFDRA